jgi:hypothetical protein
MPGLAPLSGHEICIPTPLSATMRGSGSRNELYEAAQTNRSFRMADREMIAATLAAALLVGKTFTGTRISAEEHAVATYRRMLVALEINRDSAPAKAS